jgi:hypothetical protein
MRQEGQKGQMRMMMRRLASGIPAAGRTLRKMSGGGG